MNLHRAKVLAVPGARLEFCGSRRRFLLTALASGVSLTGYRVTGAEPVRPTEAELKAAILVKLIRFVIWPDSAFAQLEAPFEIGVLGTSPFGEYLTRYSGAKTQGDRVLKIRAGTNAADLATCQVVFVARQRESTLSNVIKALADHPILLVGEEKGFATDGGMINLLIKDDKPYLQINARSAERAGLKFRGQLAQTRNNIDWIERPSVVPP